MRFKIVGTSHCSFKLVNVLCIFDILRSANSKTSETQQLCYSTKHTVSALEVCTNESKHNMYISPSSRIHTTDVKGH